MCFCNQSKLWGKEVSKGYLKWPDENVIRFMNKNFQNKNRENIKVLDLGCGAGRNVIALAEEGFDVVGVDYSDECIRVSKKRCKEVDDKEIKILKNDGVNIPLKDNHLDAVIACGSMFYSRYNDRFNLMKDINRVLKDNALFWANWRNIEDDMYKDGKEIEENLYTLNGYGRNGIVYYFSTINQLKDLYEKTGFEIYDIEKIDIYSQNLTLKNSWFNVSARKI